MGIYSVHGGCHRRQQHRKDSSEEGHCYSSTSLFETQGMYEVPLFLCVLSFYDLVFIKDLTFFDNIIIRNMWVCWTSLLVSIAVFFGVNVKLDIFHACEWFE